MFGQSILNIFAKSPIKPLQQHIDAVCAAADILPSFVENICHKNWEKAELDYNKIAKFEDEADQIKQNIRLHLPNNLFLPAPRSDLLELLTTQDEIANKAKDFAGLVLGRHMQFPKEVEQDFLAFICRCVDTTRHAQKAIHELDELLASGFRGHEVELVERMTRELDEIENDTDKRQISIRSKIFLRESALPPVDVMFMYRVLEVAGEMADRAQRVGHRLQILLAR